MGVYVELFNLEQEPTQKSCSKFSFSPYFTVRWKTSIHGYLTSIHFFHIFMVFDYVVFEKQDKLKRGDLIAARNILEIKDEKHKLKHKDLVHFSCVLYIYILA
jgi:hypothetical protein